ncbi:MULTISPECIES: hypothetical protein [unclassified Leifsonia]|uniref:hypothetical protein n=1 Tax=unclassified Leifsonia TaxID=2663824 RepID=UPI0011133722|nr:MULTISPECIES: hypothetical protein [unclassified Leifsonia]
MALERAKVMAADRENRPLRREVDGHGNGLRPTVTAAFTGRGDMVDWHVYTVTGIDEQGNVTLRNPWGPGDRDKPEILHLTFDEMCRAGWYLNIGAPPK